MGDEEFAGGVFVCGVSGEGIGVTRELLGLDLVRGEGLIIGFGGGGRGGGNFSGRGEELIIFDRPFKFAASFSSSRSVALGTLISDRYSRSSADKANDAWLALVLLVRAKRFRNLETAEGAGAVVVTATSDAVS